MKQHLRDDVGEFDLEYQESKSVGSNTNDSAHLHPETTTQHGIDASSDLGPLSLLRSTAALCAEAKAQDSIALNLQGLSDVADYLLIASGRSDRQVQGICNRVIEGLAEEGVSPVAVEGIDKGHWVVVDLGQVILHVFYEPQRAHFDLEGLWARAPRIDNLAKTSEAA